ncbi:MAG: hypothetical protein Q9168_004044 [Polycauliona sp. 1 TL-2023]
METKHLLDENAPDDANTSGNYQMCLPTEHGEEPGKITTQRFFTIRTNGQRAFHVAVALCVLLIGVVLGMCIAKAAASPLPYCESFSPAKSAISYQKLSKHSTDHNVYSKYSGPPSPEQDRAWEDLVRLMISASHKEMVLAGEDPDQSVQLSVERGYLASLGVFHELHCLRRIRYMLHKDHYYPNATDEQLQYESKHIDHCLETLRLSSMCKADVGLYTFEWITGDAKPATKSNSVANCVNWDKLHAWASKRSVGFNPALKRPSG